MQLIATLLTILAFGWETPVFSAAASEIIQILKDPENPGHAWALSRTELRYSENPRGGHWETRFDGNVLKQLLHRSDDGDMELVRVAPAGAREQSAIQLVLEARAQNRKGRSRFTLIGRNGGKSWRVQSSTTPAAAPSVSSTPQPSVLALPTVQSTSQLASAGNSSQKGSASPGGTASNVKGTGHGAGASAEDGRGAVDLASLDIPRTSASTSSVSLSPSSGSGGYGGGGLGIPEFRFMFDFWLYHRPSIAPLTFSSVHTLAMVDILPVPELQFSFELSPTPRYYQVAYQLTPRLEFRAGRIWMPFDLIGPQFPHNIFGGFVNVSQFRQPGGTAFLPDIWTDLGVGMKYQLVDSDRLSWNLQVFAVNGFQDGGTDPTGAANTYPNFGSIGSTDNNSDKAFGFRTHAMWNNWLGLGVSGYMGRYTDSGDESKQVVMLGVDGQLKSGGGFDIKGGYAYMGVGLPSNATSTSFRRGGFYVEVGQRFARTWKVFARGGSVQNDSRVASVDDVAMVGGGVTYTVGYLQLTTMYQHDLNTVANKTSYDFMAMRAAIML